MQGLLWEYWKAWPRVPKVRLQTTHKTGKIAPPRYANHQQRSILVAVPSQLPPRGTHIDREQPRHWNAVSADTFGCGMCTGTPVGSSADCSQWLFRSISKQRFKLGRWQGASNPSAEMSSSKAHLHEERKQTSMQHVCRVNGVCRHAPAVKHLALLVKSQGSFEYCLHQC